MKKTTLLTGALIVLVILNLTLIGSMFFGHHPHEGMPGMGGPDGPGRGRPREIIIEALQFSPEQIKQYDTLIKQHRSEVDALDKAIRENKQKLYALLQQSYTDQEKENLITGINKLQRQIEETHFTHFEAIKKLCNSQQKADFENMAPEFPKMFGPRPPHGRP